MRELKNEVNIIGGVKQLARNRNRDEDEYRFIASKDNLEAEAQFAKKLLDDIVDGFEKKLNDRASKWDKKFAQNASRFFADDYEGRQRSRENENNSGEKMSFGAQAIKNLVKETTKGGKFSTDKRENVSKILLEVAGIFERTAQIYIAKPIKEAISFMSNAYEANYSAIAGRMGTDRRATHGMLRSAVNELNRSSVKSVVNINKELIPAIRAATEKGFKGSEAAAVGMSNAIDQKIMPWLDTQSDGWTQLQFTLDKNALKQLKASQLAMQETRAGNRLLQSGIINQFTNDMIPTLTNIEYNTADTEQFSDEMKATMAMMVDKFNYTPQEAYNYAKKELDIKNNPFKYITEGNVLEKQKSVAYAFGKGASDSREVERRMSNYTEGMNDYGVGALAREGLINPIDGTTTTEGATRYRKFLKAELDASSVKADASLYDKAVENSKDKVTKTQAHDNWMQNTATGLAFDTNNFNHGVDMLENISKGVTAIIGILATWGAGKLLTKYGGKIISKLGGELFNKAGGKLAEEAGKKAASAAAEKAGSKLATEAAKKAAEAAGGKIAAEAGKSTLQKIGSKTVGWGASLPLTLGFEVGKYGIKSGKKDIKEGHNVRGNISRGGGILAGAGGAIAGGTAAAASMGLISAGAANAWNPVGWALLGAGGLLVAGTAIHRFAASAYDAAKDTKEASDSLIKQYNEEEKERKTTLKSIVDSLNKENTSREDLEAARKFVVDEGLTSQQSANEANIDQLKALTEAYLEATDKMNNKKEESAQNEAKNLAAKAAKTALTSTTDTLDSKILETGQNIAKDSDGLAIHADLRKTDEGKQLIATLESAINMIPDEDRKASLLKDFENASLDVNDAFTTQEAQTLVSKINKAGATTAMWNQAAQSNNLNLGNQASATELANRYTNFQKVASDITKLYNTYLSNPEEQTLESIRSKFIDLSNCHVPKADQEKIISKGGYSLEAARKMLIDSNISVPEYRTGSDYITHDQFAILHKGEAVLTASDTAAARRMSDASTISATDIVKAIQGQTKDIVEVLYTIITELQSGKSNEVFKTQGNDKNNSRLTQFFPKYNNTRNLYNV